MTEKHTLGRVLVVDDQQALCRLLRTLLSQRGLEVQTSPTAAQALAALAESPYDVALVDYRLAATDGLRLIGELRARQPGLRCILMTSYGDDALRQRAREADVFAYFDKPFSNDALIETIERGIISPPAGTSSPPPLPARVEVE